MNNNHKALVYEIHKQPHGNADSLSVVNIDGFTVVVNSASWEDGQLAVFIQPDSLVDTNIECFSFLKDPKGRNPVRISVKKLRGIYSQGCLVPAPEGSKVGDDVTELLQVKHYEPIIEETNTSTQVSGPPLFSSLPRYDLENFRKHAKCFIDGEMVNVTEKINGQNLKCVYSAGRFYVGSKSRWVKEEEGNGFWKAVRNNPNIERFCVENPNLVLWGEQYGKVKNFPYDCINGEVRFIAFDIRRQDLTFLGVQEFSDLMDKYQIPKVPVLGNIPFNQEIITQMSEGETTLGKAKTREGCVVRSYTERIDNKYGRAILKLVSNIYLEKC